MHNNSSTSINLNIFSSGIKTNKKHCYYFGCMVPEGQPLAKPANKIMFSEQKKGTQRIIPQLHSTNVKSFLFLFTKSGSKIQMPSRIIKMRDTKNKRSWNGLFVSIFFMFRTVCICDCIVRLSLPFSGKKKRFVSSFKE